MHPLNLLIRYGKSLDLQTYSNKKAIQHLTSTPQKASKTNKLCNNSPHNLTGKPPLLNNQPEMSIMLV